MFLSKLHNSGNGGRSAGRMSEGNGGYMLTDESLAVPGILVAREMEVVRNMKEGLIKIADTDNLYYDSNTRQYKSKMHCPYCGKPSGCWCYPDFESTPMWEEDYPNVYCCDVHFVLDSKGEINEIAAALGITIKPTMEEWNAAKIVKAVMEYTEFDFDVSGSSCET